jgi:hypothetical protein
MHPFKCMEMARDSRADLRCRFVDATINDEFKKNMFDNDLGTYVARNPLVKFA